MMYSWATMWSGGGWKEISLNNLFDLKLQNVDLRSLCSSMARGLAWPRPGTTRLIIWYRSTVTTWTLRRSAISFGVFVTALAGRLVSYSSTDMIWPQRSPSCPKNLPSFLLPQIGTLLLYGIADTTDSAMPQGTNGCAREDVINIRDTLREGHQRVEGIQVGSPSKEKILFWNPDLRTSRWWRRGCSWA